MRECREFRALLSEVGGVWYLTAIPWFEHVRLRAREEFAARDEADDMLRRQVLLLAQHLALRPQAPEGSVWINPAEIKLLMQVLRWVVSSCIQNPLVRNAARKLHRRIFNESKTP